MFQFALIVVGAPVAALLLALGCCQHRGDERWREAEREARRAEREWGKVDSTVRAASRPRSF